MSTRILSAFFTSFTGSSSLGTWFFRQKGSPGLPSRERVHIPPNGERKIIFKMPFSGDMLVPWRVVSLKFPPQKNSTKLGFLRFEHFDLRISYPDCERCPRGFATVFAASLTLFSQIVAGDQWSSISVPLAEARFLGRHGDFERRFSCRFCWLVGSKKVTTHTPHFRAHLQAIPLANYERNHYYSLLVEVEGCVPKVC